ncbi:MAG TPA: hypothetical protein PLC54_06470 [Spirochaetales bacterium]|nr:hypothetical protein [Spirochaetales bacterium]
MTVAQITETLDGTLLVGQELLGLEIRSACGADLMSDVMAFVKENVVLLTGLVNPQAIRTADLMDIKVIVFVRGKTPPKDMLDEAAANGQAVIATKHTMFVSCGKLWEAGLRSGGTR